LAGSVRESSDPGAIQSGAGRPSTSSSNIRTKGAWLENSHSTTATSPDATRTTSPSCGSRRTPSCSTTPIRSRPFPPPASAPPAAGEPLAKGERGEEEPE
jgi:hypothetical protein